MSENTTWFREYGWGVFTHYLARVDATAQEWNRQVEAFDVDSLADQLATAIEKNQLLEAGVGTLTAPLARPILFEDRYKNRGLIRKLQYLFF